MYFEIPLTSDPNQSFRCTIPVNDNNMTFVFDIRYNSIAEYWVMTITDDLTGEILIDSLPLIAGEYPTINILSGYEHLRIGSAYIVKSNPDNLSVCPNDLNLGTDFILVWGDNDE